MSCIICCEDFTRTSPNICCMYCNFEACRTCCETYILSEEIPKCMRPECGKEWSRKFLRENFTNSFLTNKFKEHIESVLFDKEKALLPATQLLVEEKKRKNAHKKQIEEINALINDLVKQKRDLENVYHGRIPEEQKPEEKKPHKEKTHGRIREEQKPEEQKPHKEKTHGFVRQCPADKCRGFLSTQWKCGLCEKWTCPDCHELKGISSDCEHKCDPNSVETAKMLKQDSKPCPKCQCLIFKISGCDQMWCTQCRTAFNWINADIINRDIHNPHYHEWIYSKTNSDINNQHYEWNNQNNELIAQPIGDTGPYGLGSIYHDVIVNIRRSALKLGLSDDTRINLICEVIRYNMHNTDVELPHFQIDYFEKNVNLRMEYLENTITEEEFKILIQRNDKKNRKNMEISQIIQLSIDRINDIGLRFDSYLKKCIKKGINVNLEMFIDEIEEIQKYCNNVLRDIAFTYNSSQYKFDSNFIFKNIGKIEKKPKKSEEVEEIIVFKFPLNKRKKVITIEDDKA